MAELVAQADRVRQSWSLDSSPLKLTELIFVDDAAVDGSGALMDRLAADHPWITAPHLSRNFGQHAATVAAILHSFGDWIVTLNEDLQHPPDRIEDLLLQAVRRSDDVVYARPKSKAVHGKAWRDDSSRRFKQIMEWPTGTPALRLVNSFRLMRGSIARATASVCIHNTYFDIALTWFTQSISAIDIEMRDERFAASGKSGYTRKKLIQHAQRMLFSSHLRLLSVALWIGGGLFVFSFLAAIYFFFLRLLLPDCIGVEGWTSIFVVVCASAGVLSIMLGIALQYLSTPVLKAHGRPKFFTIDRSQDSLILDWLTRREKIATLPEDAA